jgi:hypothetical protein
MKISPIILSTLLTAVIMWFFALYEVGPLSGCQMGLMLLPFMLGIVPPITGVLSLPTYLILILFERKGLTNQLAQTFIALIFQLQLSFVIAALVTPIENDMMWRGVIGA